MWDPETIVSFEWAETGQPAAWDIQDQDDWAPRTVRWWRIETGVPDFAVVEVEAPALVAFPE